MVSMLRFLLLTLTLIAVHRSFANAASIDTVAGTGKAENNGNQGAADQINIKDPFGVEIGPDGALYITEVGHHRVWRLDRASAQLTVVAGNGTKGYSGDGGPATEAQLNEPYEIRFDRQGNMFFVEMQNHVVRRVDARTRTISTVAGNGQQGFGGDGGRALDAQLNRPHSIALDHRGGLYIADIGNHRIRHVDLPSGKIRSLAGSDQARLPADGQPATGTPVLGPRALFIEGTTMWVALREGHSVWRLDLVQPVWRHVAGTGKRGYSGDGDAAARATFDGPKGIAVGPQGNVYVADTENHAIRVINVAAGTIATVAGGRQGDGGDGGPAERAGLDRPHGICVDEQGVLYIGDTLNHRVRRVQ